MRWNPTSALCLSFIMLPVAALAGAEAEKLPAPRLVAPTGAEPEKLPPPRLVDAKPSPKSASDDPKSADEPKESERLTQFKALTIDRRPSNILNVWKEVNSPTPPAKGPPAKDTPSKKKKDGKSSADASVKKVQQDIVLGRWDQVRTFLKSFSEAEADEAYMHLLSALQNRGQSNSDQSGGDGEPVYAGRQQEQIPPQFLEQNSFSIDDVVGIAAAAPSKFDDKHLKQLGRILALALSTGRGVVENAVERFDRLSKLPANQAPLTRRQMAKLLVEARQAAYADRLLPTFAEAVAAKDGEALNLLAAHFFARHGQDLKPILLERSWESTQEALTLTGVDPEIRNESMRRAVELAPRVKETLGQRWLEESFSRHIDRGREILVALGNRTAKGIQARPMAANLRLGELKLQKLAVEALVKAAPDQAKQWKPQLSLLLNAWLSEAEFSHQFDRSASLGPRMQYDPFGNLYYQNDDDDMPPYMRGQQMQFQAIRIGELIEILPEQSWLDCCEAELKPKFAHMVGQLYLKVKEEAKAYPYVEQLAATHPDKARNLLADFLRVWTTNHNLNSQKERRNPYIFYYGFERRNEGIPLTRSKQERNLVELSEWVGKIHKLPLGEIDQELLAKAFTSCHSSAEVYRLEAIEAVFGPLKQIKPRTLASLVQQTRENLAGVWRDPAVQEEKKTNRKSKDIQQEVIRGYGLALSVVENSLKQFPDEWSLTLAKAALMHDEMNYQHEIAPSSDYVARRDASMAQFAKAAQQYAAKVKELPVHDHSIQLFEQWYGASIGAVDVRFVDEDKLADGRQPAKIRAAILGLPGELAEKHMSKFANGLFTKMSGVKPASKFRYLKSGFDIVGDHKQAWESKKLFDYYKDLVTEIKLEAVVDGSTNVGHDVPFGVFINLRHTREIERESGGFGRFLQNQNSGRYFSYNYGRPTTDYRDKFETAVKQALKENFEVLSVTFQDDKVHSRAAPEYGWRITPYAYLLLKPRGPQIDLVPPVRLDLDFMDMSGYVVLPVASPALPIDASSSSGEPRPARKIQITQILDERQSQQGKLILEVKATAQGLLGDLDSLVDIPSQGLVIKQKQPQPVTVSRFDPEADPTAIVAERSWMIHFEAAPGQSLNEFQFGKSKVAGAEMVYQRYSDADLATVGETVSLERDYQHRDYVRLAVWVGAGLVILALAVAAWRWRASRRPVAASAFPIPERLDVFSLMGLLERIDREVPLDPERRTELRQTVAALEKQYFSANVEIGSPTDLRSVAEKWTGFAEERA